MKTLLALLLAIASSVFLAEAAEGKSPHILMIAVDDLRPMLGCYGDERIQTPHIDRLANSGMLFERAYCNYAKCGPSRLSLMTGLRPSSVGVFGHGVKEVDDFRSRRADAVSVARWFKDHGYDTRSFGKIDHDGWQIPDDWSAPPFAGREGEMMEIVDQGAPDGPTIIADRHECPVMQSPDVPDDHFFDGRMTTEALRQLKERSGEKPFFFAVGYRRPHLPFVAPKRYYDLYEPDESWLTPHPEPPAGVHPLAWFNSDGYVGAANRVGLSIPSRPDRETAIALNGYEMRSYLGVPVEGEIPKPLQIDLVHAYAACVSYVDAQIGRLLDYLDESGVRDSTIVLLWSDHGWHLGEKSAWGKMTNYEVSTRVPLLLSVPGLSAGRTRSLTELVDLYPTLCELAGLPAPAHLEGDSFAAVLNDPETSLKEAVRHEYVRHRGTLVGKAVRTARFRYVLWRDKDGKVEEEELYDLETDPHEMSNLASENPERAAEFRKRIE